VVQSGSRVSGLKVARNLQELHQVQATLGHTNISMTSTYLSATTQSVTQAFKKLEAKRRRQGLKAVGRANASA
jgi:integrase